MRNVDKDTEVLHKCKDCGAIYSEVTLPGFYLSGIRVTYCKVCNSRDIECVDEEG